MMFQIPALVWGVILILTPTRAEFISTNYAWYNDGKLGHRPQHTFHSSDQYAPVLQVNIWNQTRTPAAATGSHIFLRSDGTRAGAVAVTVAGAGDDEPALPPTAAPLILDAADLTTVYVNRSFDNVFGTRVQENLGRKYLTFWAGRKGEGVGDGFGLAYDETYRLAYNISTQGFRTHADLHEFAFTGHGTALVTGIDKKRVETSGWENWHGHPIFPVLDAVFQEIDLETNEVLFSWSALDHIDPTDSSEPWGRDWDAYHLNSVEKTQEGNYLISIRHTHSIHLISGETGEILWTLGGKRNDFVELPPANGTGGPPLAPLLSMGWQHHARFVPGTGEAELTLFDNHVKQTSHGTCDDGTCSRGLHVRLDAATSPPTARLLGEYLHPSQLQAQSQGSMQSLFSNRSGTGDAADDADAEQEQLQSFFIGWGRCPSFTEHDAATGETLLDVQFSPWHSKEIPDALDNYRAYRLDWRATPWWKPSLALMVSREGDLDVFTSWNGATEVREWVVRGVVVRSSSPSSRANMVQGGGEVLARSRRTGFETKLTVNPFGLWYLWAEALDAHGAVIGATERVNFDEANVTVLPFENEEYYDAPDAESESESSWTWSLLAGAAVGFVLVAIAGRVLWMRARGYKLVHDDDDDIDLDSDSDDESVSGLDLFTNDLGPEAWQDYAPRLGPRLG